MWKEISDKEQSMVEYKGVIPNKLYRYRSIDPETIDERLINFEILDEAIFLAGLKDLNDPDEGRFLMEFDGTKEEIFAFWKSAIQAVKVTSSSKQVDDEANINTARVIKDSSKVPDYIVHQTRNVLENLVRVACFTTEPVNYSMWANYAKYFHPTKGPQDHAGVCIEYKCDDNWKAINLHPVEYTNILPKLNPVTLMEKDLVQTLYMKTREWRGEEEWRIMSVIKAKPPFPKNLTANSKVKISDSVTGVIFGMKTPEAIVKDIVAKVTIKRPDITFQKVIKNPTTYCRELIKLV
jgi:hypothetical protein